MELTGILGRKKLFSVAIPNAQDRSNRLQVGQENHPVEVLSQ
jgi:hypothetical protein